MKKSPRWSPSPTTTSPPDERIVVKVGKTPYARFDKNDYSVPHTHVRRLLEVIATDERVRTIDPEQAADSKPLGSRSFVTAMFSAT